jgi:hypothetical protein
MGRLDNSEIMSRLEKLAFRKTTPFCYSCYRAAPSGRCVSCGSDDLMRELAGEGVEYGVDWVIRALVRNALTPADTAEAFEDSAGQCYPETTQVGWLTLDTVMVLKAMDPISWGMAESEWIDAEVSDDSLITFDNGSTYYWTSAVEGFLDESESEENSA